MARAAVLWIAQGASALSHRDVPETARSRDVERSVRILDYEVSRAFTATAVLKLRDSVLGKGDLLVATGRNGPSRGVLLVKANGGMPVVFSVGY